MKKLQILRYMLLIIGSLYILACAVLPLAKYCLTAIPEEFYYVQKLGIFCPFYYVNVVTISFLIGITHFIKNSYQLVTLLALINLVSVILVNLAGLPSPATLCGNTPTIYQYAMYVANLLVITCCYMNVARK